FQSLEVGDDVLPLLLVLYAGEDHFRARHSRPRIGQIRIESLRIPGMVEFLHPLGVIIVVEARGFAADYAEQARPDLVLASLGSMTKGAFLEIRLASLDIGGRNGAGRGKREQDAQAEV